MEAMDRKKMRAEARKRNRQQSLRVFFGRGLITKVAFVILVLFVFVAVFADFIAPCDPNKTELRLARAGISAAHLLGCDALGRDVLSRIIFGARVSLFASVLAGLIGGAVGMFLGLVAGYSKKFLGGAIMRFTDALLCIPNMILTLVMTAILGGGLYAIVVSIAVGMVPTYIRMVVGMVSSLRENDYIIASELLGENRTMKVLFKHLLPNCFPSLIVLFTMNLGTGIMLEAALSYLGVGIQPPTATWGGMISNGFQYLTTNPGPSIYPGICIVLVVVSFNIVGDSLRDALDPRLRGKL